MSRNRRKLLIVLFLVLGLCISLSDFVRRSVGSQSVDQFALMQKELESEFPVANYDEALPKEAAKKQQRVAKNARYDGKRLVISSPHPNEGGAIIYDEVPELPALPFDES